MALGWAPLTFTKPRLAKVLCLCRTYHCAVRTVPFFVSPGLTKTDQLFWIQYSGLKPNQWILKKRQKNVYLFCINFFRSGGRSNPQKKFIIGQKCDGSRQHIFFFLQRLKNEIKCKEQMT